MSLHTSSSSTSSAEGTTFPWILEHLLAYPGSYEIPLRTMYTLNSTPQAQPFPRQYMRADTPSLCSSDGSSPDSAPASPHFPPEQQLVPPSATEHFKSCLMTHISKLPTQPFSLPPSFITSFVRRCFTADLCLVDFTQALTALDYLKDLESRRRRELTLALQRLGVDKESINETGGDIMRRFPGVAGWITSMQDKERKVEALYTQVYIGLRRWTLINEMRLEPFSKPNSIAMLNTLYPPTSNGPPPTRQLTTTILNSQRQAFFRYIQGVEKNGKEILKNLEKQGVRPGEANGWALVREVVDKYLRAANGMIEECAEVTGTDTFDPKSEEYRHNERRTDSGISFATTDRPSTGSSDSSRNNSIPTVNTSRTNSIDKSKPLPDCPNTVVPSVQPLSPKKRGTTLEKIAREIRNLRSRNDVREMDHRHPSDASRPQDLGKSHALKKMKSTSSISAARSKHARSGSGECSGAPSFEIDDLKRERLLQEARREKGIREREKENREPPPKAANILGKSLAV